MATMNSIGGRRTARISAALPCAVLLAACATMTEQQCRMTSWYDLGYRDGDVYGIRPQVEIYAQQCGSLEPAAHAAYMTGWVDGYREWSSRVQATEHP